MIQIDTKHIRPTTSHKLYQFTAIDIIIKRRVLVAYSSKSSSNGALFLRKCMNAFPFKINNTQTDNGSTFQKHFDETYEMIDIPHYYIYPRSPKQNCYVEHDADER
ncbi:MAG: DDE-type integrase/transposase/recombinase [Candidatus Pacebacteria bacterium]|nr:DDE-type integrase/transposase/recombinase [Candidatus Paceibacterota bacterium]